MKRWILLIFVGLVGCNPYVDPDWYNEPAFTDNLATIYAYPSVSVTPSKPFVPEARPDSRSLVMMNLC
jgi:hypothetical protein